MNHFDDIAAIVVHHKHFPDVLHTCDLLTQCGLPAHGILIVDNSANDHIRDALASAVIDKYPVIFVRNAGYANAINLGISWLREHNGLKEFLLVSTHEVKPRPGAVAHMRELLRENLGAAVVGPTLVSRHGEEERVWSTGGHLSRLLNYPHHLDVGISIEWATAQHPAKRDWLDGSFCLYRSADLLQSKLPEDYFLYMEETDFHTQLRKRGRHVLWCPQALAQQETNGIPPFLLGRNLQIFQHRQGNTLQILMTVPVLMAKRGLDVILRKHSAADWLSIVRGWLAGLSYRRQQAGHQVSGRRKSLCASS